MKKEKTMAFSNLQKMSFAETMTSLTGEKIAFADVTDELLMEAGIEPAEEVEEEVEEDASIEEEVKPEKNVIETMIDDLNVYLEDENVSDADKKSTEEAIVDLEKAIVALENAKKIKEKMTPETEPAEEAETEEVSE